MISFPNAKINLGLNIIEKRPDGFHNLETIFYPIPLTDVLEILVAETTISGKVAIEVSGTDIPGLAEENLCVRAYRMLDADFQLPAVRIFLHKLTPMGAGLGGGSADGAYTLRMLNQLFNLALTDEILCTYAERLGSDCAFFIKNRASLGTGKGNLLAPIPLDLKGYYIVLVKPDVFVSTAEAYAGIQPSKPTVSVAEMIAKPIETWKEMLVNDFEASIFDKHPAIRNVKYKLYQNGALYAAMSGSGSSVFGIFQAEVHLKELFSDCFYWDSWL